MGTIRYESRIYVVKKSKILFENKKYYATEIAKLNMSECGKFFSVFSKDTDCYIYADDGETPIFYDRHNNKLKEATLNDVVQWLDNTISSGVDYRRFKVALALLKSFQTDQWDGENIVVLHYGY